jgi:hypothetical protein
VRRDRLDLRAIDSAEGHAMPPAFAHDSNAVNTAAALAPSP